MGRKGGLYAFKKKNTDRNQGISSDDRSYLCGVLCVMVFYHVGHHEGVLYYIDDLHVGTSGFP